MELFKIAVEGIVIPISVLLIFLYVIWPKLMPELFDKNLFKLRDKTLEEEKRSVSKVLEDD